MWKIIAVVLVLFTTPALAMIGPNTGVMFPPLFDPPSGGGPVGGESITWGDATLVTWGDGTQITWSGS